MTVSMVRVPNLTHTPPGDDNPSYRKNELEEKMLLNLNKNKWSQGLRLEPFDKHGRGCTSR